MPSNETRTIDAMASELLAVTEEIHSGLMEAGEVDRATSAFDRREILFSQLQRASAEGEALSAGGRTSIDRVRALDAEILALGDQRVEKIRGERHGLLRRRSAIAAHSRREREEPRLITLKA